ncbi:MAG TPA: hypothetical protein PLD35_01565 [Caldisericia bacterium]|nr:hypothetical protein [Bacteroidales bacterium]MDD3428073.1 hypothetical protein [Caldisericia bacterium]HOJ16849.1 hypothetical protein [Caldisericia bacterium]HPO28689.1 hypothetical protein [Caldisericia bacterium]HXK69847.1 hypothetical protein [Caldisericia bacterium]
MSDLVNKKDKPFVSLGKIILIGGVSIVVLQTAAHLLLLSPFLEIFPYKSHLSLIFSNISSFPPFHLYRFFYFTIALVFFIPILYIFLISLLKRGRKDTLIRVFTILFVVALVIGLLRAICYTWDDFNQCFLLNIAPKTRGLDTLTFLSGFLQLALWMVFMMFCPYSDKIRSVRLLFYSQCWIVFFWLITLPIAISVFEYISKNTSVLYLIFSLIALVICQMIAILQAYIISKDKDYVETYLKFDTKKIMNQLLACLLILLSIPTVLYYASYPKSFNEVNLKLNAQRDGNDLVIKVKTNLVNGALISYTLSNMPYERAIGELIVNNGECETRILNIPKDPIKVRIVFSVGGKETKQPKHIIDKYGYFGERIKKKEKKGDTTVGYTVVEALTIVY